MTTASSIFKSSGVTSLILPLFQHLKQIPTRKVFLFKDSCGYLELILISQDTLPISRPLTLNGKVYFTIYGNKATVTGIRVWVSFRGYLCA